jgi:SAM-dependent methyltransferase
MCRRSRSTRSPVSTLIHVPRDQHARVLAHFNRGLKPGGCLLLITGNGDLPNDVDDFFGAEMYWSHFDRAISHLDSV